jgi:hypothetical protein
MAAWQWWVWWQAIGGDGGGGGGSWGRQHPPPPPDRQQPLLPNLPAPAGWSVTVLFMIQCSWDHRVVVRNLELVLQQLRVYRQR